MSNLARKQLDKRFENKDLPFEARPPRGWLRAIRQALGMTTVQFAKRLSVAQSRISALEKAEVDESVTLASLRRAAEALDCKLVYAIVPRKPLEAMVMERARAVAAKRLARVDHTMRLENQAVDREELEREITRLAMALSETPRRLWSEP